MFALSRNKFFVNIYFSVDTVSHCEIMPDNLHTNYVKNCVLYGISK